MNDSPQRPDLLPKPHEGWEEWSCDVSFIEVLTLTKLGCGHQLVPGGIFELVIFSIKKFVLQYLSCFPLSLHHTVTTFSRRWASSLRVFVYIYFCVTIPFPSSVPAYSSISIYIDLYVQTLMTYA